MGWVEGMNLGLGQTLGGRYKIVARLGQGGFGTTFIAQDWHLPGNHSCVVKQLKPQATDPLTLQAARRLFDTEAKVLHQLGTHGQIPQLFAYFEENQEFYLVQELVEGDDLSKEIAPGTQRSESQVIALLQEILEILEFVHQHNVIHRDINPHNLIRRKSDGKLVLIDFGAVKQVSTQVLNGAKTSFTIAIGTPGYRPSEQANGNPKLSSDIYAVGMVGIQALTGLLPQALPTNPDTCEISWRDRVSVSPQFAKVLDKMVRYDFRERYPSATAALLALKDLTQTTSATVALPRTGLAKLSVPKPKLAKPLLTKIAIAFGTVGIGAAVTVSAVKLIRSANATDLYHRGETLLALKRYDDALNAYNRALTIRPEYAEAWQGQGDALLELEEYEEALEAYDKAIQIQPDYLEAWNGRGQALDRLERYEEAIASFDSTLNLRPDNLDAWNGRGNAQLKSQQYSAAIASFDKVIELQPDSALTWKRRGWALHNLRRYEEAVESYDKAIEFKPDAAQSWYQRGNALINLEEYEKAVESYDKAVQFQPDFYQAWYSRGNALNQLRDYEEAVASFGRAVKLQPNRAEAWYSQGWALHQMNRYEEAFAAYSKAIEFRQNDAQAWYNRGNVLYNLQRYQDAIASYNRAFALRSDYYEAYYSRGNALFNLERYSEAIDSFDKALRYKPDYREAKKAKERSQRELDEIRGKREEEEREREREEEKDEERDN